MLSNFGRWATKTAWIISFAAWGLTDKRSRPFSRFCAAAGRRWGAQLRGGAGAGWAGEGATVALSARAEDVAEADQRRAFGGSRRARGSLLNARRRGSRKGIFEEGHLLVERAVLRHADDLWLGHAHDLKALEVFFRFNATVNIAALGKEGQVVNRAPLNAFESFVFAALILIAQAAGKAVGVTAFLRGLLLLAAPCARERLSPFEVVR
jgi:hypothetical protein